MKINIIAVAAAALTSSLLMTTPSMAEDDTSYRFEITPFTAYRTGGQFEQLDGDAKLKLEESTAFGLLLNGSVRPDAQWEVLYARQSTEIDTQGLFDSGQSADLKVDYYQFGGTLLFKGEALRPFIALTIGMSRFDPQAGEFSAENFFSGSFGAGVQLLRSKRVGLRLEGRLYGTFVDENSRIFCGSDGGVGACLIQLEGSIVTQWEARAGVVFRF
jgi:hypothetical protein